MIKEMLVIVKKHHYTKKEIDSKFFDITEYVGEDFETTKKITIPSAVIKRFDTAEHIICKGKIYNILERGEMLANGVKFVSYSNIIEGKNVYVSLDGNNVLTFVIKELSTGGGGGGTDLPSDDDEFTDEIDWEDSDFYRAASIEEVKAFLGIGGTE